jgi:hypothetical protein
LHERGISKGSIVIRASRRIFFVLSLLDMKDDELMSKTIREEKTRNPRAYARAKKDIYIR